LFVLDPTLECKLTLGEDIIAVGISKGIHNLVRVCKGQNHSHSRFELHAVLEGSLRADVEDDTYIIKAGQGMLIAPQQHHRIVPETPDYYRVTVGITPLTDGLHRAMTGQVYPCRVLKLEPELEKLLQGIVRESEEARSFHEEMIRLWLAEIAILLLRQLGLSEKLPQAPFKGRDGTLDIIDNYFESNIGQNPSADDLAERLHISRRHLHRILQKTYGMGFREKLLRARMDRAAWLLRHTEKSVSVIAGEVGYTYDSAFRQAFRGRYEVTPQEYRQQHKRKENDHL